mgnify:CR=1 FL=1
MQVSVPNPIDETSILTQPLCLSAEGYSVPNSKQKDRHGFVNETIDTGISKEYIGVQSLTLKPRQDPT